MMVRKGESAVWLDYAAVALLRKGEMVSTPRESLDGLLDKGQRTFLSSRARGRSSMRAGDVCAPALRAALWC